MSDSICKNFKIQAIIPEFKRKWKGNDVATSLNQRHKWKWQRIGISNLNLFFKKSTTIYYACFNNYFQMLTLAQQTIDLCLVDPFNMHLNDCLKQRTSFSRYGYKPKLINWLNPIFFFRNKLTFKTESALNFCNLHFLYHKDDESLV